MNGVLGPIQRFSARPLDTEQTLSSTMSCVSVVVGVDALNRLADMASAVVTGVVALTPLPDRWV
jgi:hypothetical protein